MMPRSTKCAQVINPLNKLLDAQVADNLMGWTALDPTSTAVDDVRKRGWCHVGSAKAYEAQGRWFRSIIDSKRFQGNEQGSFHPTLEFNDQIQGYKIAQKFKEHANAEPDWGAVSVSPSKVQGDTLLVSAQPVFNYFALNTSLPTLSSTSLPGWLCQPSSVGCSSLSPGFTLGAHGATVTIDGHASSTAPRKYERKKLLKLQVDAKPPRISCRPAGAETVVSCVSMVGLNRHQFDLIVEDPEAGVTQASVTTFGKGNSHTETELRRQTENLMDMPVQLPKDGNYRFSVCANDGVGNATGSRLNCGVIFDVNVITKPPLLTSFLAHKIDWSHGGRVMPIVPVFGDSPPDLNVAFAIDANFVVDATPVKCEPGCQIRPVLPAEEWQRTDTEVKGIDMAGNMTTVPYAVIRLPEFSSAHPRRGASVWRSGAGGALPVAMRAAFSLQPDLSGLVKTGNLDVKTALATLMDDHSSVEQRESAANLILNNLDNEELVIDWMNMVSGAIYPMEKVPFKLLSECEIRKGVPAGGFTQLQWLNYRAQCASGADAATM